MRHLVAVLTVLATLLGVAVSFLVSAQGGPSCSSDEETRVVGPPPATICWEGPARTASTGENPHTGAPFSEDGPHYADFTLLHVDVAPSYWNGLGGGLMVRVRNSDADPLNSFRTYVYATNAQGTEKRALAATSNQATMEDIVFIGRASGYYLVQVIYATRRDTSYVGEAWLETRPLLAHKSQNPGLSRSLPWNVRGPRPGPAVLYRETPSIPQLMNHDPRFRAPPLMVSGSEAYIAGEYLYQDYIYDDHGAGSVNDVQARTGQPRVGDVIYPDDDPARPRYAHNAADLLEFRIATFDTEVAYRITLNTLLEPDSTIVAIAFDTDLNEATGGSKLPLDPAPLDPEFKFPGIEEVILTWGTGARHYRRVGEAWYESPLDALHTDPETNQITVVVPRAISDPRGKWRAVVATGLYDASTVESDGGWHLEVAGKSGIYNLGFRFDEPVFADLVPPDTMQAVALRDGNLRRYAHAIDFAKLDARVTESRVPMTGPQVRLFASDLLGTKEGREADFAEYPTFLGPIQPYFAYVPTTYRPGRPAGVMLLLPFGGNYYWAYNREPDLLRRMGEENGNIVLVPLGRGVNSYARNEGEVDPFEAWRDLASHFSLDPDRAAIAGVSAGGYSAYRLGLLYPDLFGKAATWIAPIGEPGWIPPTPPQGAVQGQDPTRETSFRIHSDLTKLLEHPEALPDYIGEETLTTLPEYLGAETLTNLLLDNARNLPYINVAGALDELVSITGVRAQNLGAPELGIKGFADFGYRFHFRVYETGNHSQLVASLLQHSYPLVQSWLKDSRIDRDPAHVTLTYVPAADEPADGPGAETALQLRHDHAYWVYDLVLHDAQTPYIYGGHAYPAKGLIDVFSRAFGVSRQEPPPTGLAGLAQPRASDIEELQPTIPFTDFSRAAPPEAPAVPENRLDMRLTNLRAASLEMTRAGIDLSRLVTLQVSTDHTSELLLAGKWPPAVTVTGATLRSQTSEGVLIEVAPCAPLPALCATRVTIERR